MTKRVEVPMRVHQRPLFSKLNLSSVLDQRFELAMEQFAEGALKGDTTDLLLCIMQRFSSAPIQLLGSIQLQEVWEGGDGTQEFQYGFRFDGDPIFWECSPDKIHDLLPEGYRFDDWDQPPGETMGRPRGEYFRSDLIIVCKQPFHDRDLEPVRELLKQQALVIEYNDKYLMHQLSMMAANC